MLSARGGFDPKLEGELMRKNYDGKRYYDLLQGGVKIPTWLGITVQGGYTQNEGVFLNPERLTPDQGLLHAGVTVPLGEGLFIDARRAELRKAELIQELALAERELLLNEMLFNAGMAYWDWFRAHHAERIYAEGASLAEQRLDAVRQSARLGDRPAIDTLEASIQFQARTIQLQQATLDVKNAAARMSVHLWLEGELPMVIDPRSIPLGLEVITATPPDPLFLVDIEAQIANHPFLMAQGLDISAKKIDQRWKREQIKPQVNLKYNALTESLGGTETTGFNADDFTFGLQVSMPILLRKERGALALAGLRIEEKEMELAIKEQDIWLKARMALNDWDVIAQQLSLFEGTARDYASLLNGERDLFSAGESSLFLVNSRESNYVNAQVKRIDLKAKNRMAELKTRYAMALLNQ
jgi:outer membrane protein TolC